MVRSLREGYRGSSMVRHRAMRILQVSTVDIAGGAEKVAWNLFQAYQQRGLPSWLAVGRKRNHNPNILEIPNDEYRSRWARTWMSIGNMLSPLVSKVRGAGRVRKWLHWIGEPNRWLEIQRGLEDFDFPGTWHLLNLPPKRPDILHCHNLHGGYFNLRALPWLSHQIPMVLTLHDAWLLSGHCAHSFDCERWKVGCGQCPDLSIYPAIKRDATAYNWRRKRDIYSRSRLYVATPSHWLMRKVEQSILAPGIVEARVIPNGVDLAIFHPGNQREARRVLDISQEAKVLLFAANGIRQSIWRDYQNMRVAVARVAECLPGQEVLFIALGENAPVERIDQAEMRFIPYQKDPKVVARYYQAADVYVHPAKADTFPNTVLEALACGTPVVATAVGGILEQVKVGVTGFLVPPGDAEAMAEAVIKLLTDDALRTQLGNNAAKDAQRRFDLNRQVDDYLKWYQEIINHRHAKII